jgi:phosphate uptake regulator
MAVMLEVLLGSALIINGNSNNDQINREYDNINNYEESIAKKVNIIVHACMPQQRIDDYGSFNDIMNLTISTQCKIICVDSE